MFINFKPSFRKFTLHLYGLGTAFWGGCWREIFIKMFLSPSLIRNYTLEMHPPFFRKNFKISNFLLWAQIWEWNPVCFWRVLHQKKFPSLVRTEKAKIGGIFQKNFKKIAFSTFSTNPRCKFVYLLKRLTTEKILFTCYNWEAKNVSLFLKK